MYRVYYGSSSAELRCGMIQDLLSKQDQWNFKTGWATANRLCIYLFYDGTVDSSELDTFAKNGTIVVRLEMSSALWATLNVTCSIKQRL